jgi:ParB-like chromosome segregation protein Spo0J
MGYREPKPQTLSSAVGVKGVIATRARSRRETQRALNEIDTHAPRLRRNDLAPRLRLETRAIESLRPASRSVRRRDAKQNAKLQASVGRFGLCRPILIDAEGTIVEGHGLWEVARAQGISEVSCIVIDHLDKTELRSLSTALNRLGETGADALRLEFEELTVLGVDLVETGFETAEIDGLMLLDDDEDLAAGDTPAPQRLETAGLASGRHLASWRPPPSAG